MPSITRNIQRGEEVQEVILKCGGLPEVIVSIAALMVDRTTWMDVRSLNRKFMHHLETNRECDSLRGLFGWINSYLRSSSDSLKPCILYLPIFPPENIIRRKRLVRRWIAEGYARDNNDKSAEERAEMFFSQLIDLSIIHQPLQKISTSAAVNTKMSLYQVNRFICEYIVSRRVEENLVFELGGGYNPTYQRSGRHLVIWKSWDRNIVLFKTIDFSRLRSLTVFGRWESFFVCKSMKTIRVVDLENASGVTDGDLVKIVKLLHRLKFLSLRGQREICHLPSSLGYLRQLQTLDVRGTSIVALPESITKLDKLQYIRAGSNNDPAQHHQCRHSLVSVEVPRGIGNVTALHTLGVVNVPASGGKALVEELKKLTQLRKIGLTDINRKNNAIVSTVSGHVHLESLLVCIDKDNQCCLEDISLPWRNLRSLKLYGIGDKLPESIKELSDLTKLYLEMATLMQRDVELLGNLPQLCIMRLDVKQPSLHFYSEIYGQELVTYAKVKILEISCSSSRLHVTFGSSSMKNLELLKLDCSSASYQLTGLNYLSKLKQVVLKGTNDETIKTDLESQLANHPKTPAVKLEEVPLSS